VNPNGKSVKRIKEDEGHRALRLPREAGVQVRLSALEREREREREAISR
jgi:hypothetical protein